MTDLLRYWVKGLVTEIMRGPHGLPDDVTVLIRDIDAGTFAVMYADEHGRGYDLSHPGHVNGRITCSKRWDTRYGNAYEVSLVSAVKGYGPLLYDVAMEYATMKGGGLMADRHAVSDAALDVWKHYMRRPDVESHEMRGETWDEPPLSLRFTKEPATIQRLEALGKLNRRGGAKKR